MKQLLTLFVLALAVTCAHGQCQGVVVTSSTIISTNGTYTNSGTFWVCEGVTATFTGDDSRFYIEPGCSLTMTGDDGEGSVRGNSILAFTGTSNIFIYDQAATIVNNGTSNNFINCNTALVFDYTLVSGSGCLVVGIEELSLEARTRIFPNPAGELLKVEVDGAILNSLRVIDATGGTIITDREPRGIVDLRSLAAGAYFVEVRTDLGTIHRTFIVE